MVEKITGLIRILVVVFTALYAHQASAIEMTLISDAQTQNYLSQIVKPLFDAAHISFNAGKIFLVDDNSLNAFVSDGNYLFVHTGTIIQAENTNELAGILAHETGHIMGGHIVRMKLKMENMKYVILGSVLAAGAAAVSTGRGDAAAAVLLGSQSAVMNSMLSHQIQEERSADKSAVKLLNQTKQSTDGLLAFMNKIKKRNSLSGIDENNYFRTHPFTEERIAHFIDASKNNHFPSQSHLDGEFALVKAKLAAFLWDYSKVARMYPASDKSMAARYARCIMNFRQGKIYTAISLIDGLVAEAPKNPYFYELKGQILFESGQIKESIAAYKYALSLLPNNYLLQISLAHAIIEDGKNMQEAVNLLQKSRIGSNSAFSWMLLSQAYDRLNQTAASRYAAAEFNYAIGRTETTKKLLEEALKSNPDKTLQLRINDLKQKIKNEE